MNKIIILIIGFLVLSVSGIAQKEHGVIWGIAANGGIPLGQFRNTHGFGYGGDVAVENNPKYIPSKGFTLDIYDAFNYTLSAGYLNFTGRDSVDAGGIIKRKNAAVIPVLIGMKGVSSGKYLHIQAGCSFTKYLITKAAFAYAFNWGLVIHNVDLSVRFQGTIREANARDSFIGFRLAVNSGYFTQ
jgi:hypothetical protein